MTLPGSFEVSFFDEVHIEPVSKLVTADNLSNQVCSCNSYYKNKLYKYIYNIIYNNTHYDEVLMVAT